MAEIAEALEVSKSTVEKDWEFARVWLFDRLGGVMGDPAGPDLATLYQQARALPEHDRDRFLADNGLDAPRGAEVLRLCAAAGGMRDDFLAPGLTAKSLILDPLVGRVFGAYRLEKRLGEGGWGRSTSGFGSTARSVNGRP